MELMMRKTSWFLLFALASGCTSTESFTAAYIGCRPDDIQISENDGPCGWPRVTAVAFAALLEGPR